MDFTLDEQQSDIHDLARGLIAKCLADEPSAAPQGADWFDRDLWQALAQAGLLGIGLEEGMGGSGMGFAESCLVIEQVARAAGRVPYLESVVLAAMPLQQFGSAEQRARWLPGFCAGEVILTSTVRTEPHVLPGIRVAQTASGLQLDGVAGHIPLADVADRILVAARDEAHQT